MDSQECVWSDITVNVFGTIVRKTRRVRYGKNVNQEHLHAAGDEPIGIQKGNKTYQGALTVLKGGLDEMNAAARRAGYKDISEVPYQAIVLTHTYKAAFGRPIQTDVMAGVSFSGYEKGMEQGGLMMEVELPYLALNLTEA